MAKSGTKYRPRFAATARIRTSRLVPAPIQIRKSKARSSVKRMLLLPSALILPGMYWEMWT